ncbi:mgpp2cl-1, protein phosphatase 2C-like protein 1 [Sporothrix eucalyptigena]|uniref:Mgpp2cl-1, protein phosphatase 2C-like protein 1 n=1 Tax=Sporothrix eucalyptigena TaxID=1812306 RepID=A0ABP0B141_9PEZI
MFGGSSSASLKPESAIDDSGSSDTAPTPGSSAAGAVGGTRKNSNKSPSPEPDSAKQSAATPIATAGEKATKSVTPDGRSGNGSPPTSGSSAEAKKRRSSGVSSRASSLLASAKNTLNFSQSGRSNNDGSSSTQTPLQKLGKQDAALAVPQGQHNNSAGESLPGPRSTFRVGVWEDRNKKCRRTMEDTHAFLYNFLRTPAPASTVADKDSTRSFKSSSDSSGQDAVASSSGNSGANLSGDSLETDNGYFAIFDGHAGTFAADWCGKKLHLILEEIIRKNPNAPIPELLDQTFTSVDAQLEKLPLKNSGCTAAVAVLRWEDRVPSNQSATGSQGIAMAAAAKANDDAALKTDEKAHSTGTGSTPSFRTTGDVESAHAKLRSNALRQRVLYTANVGDARIILCRSGKALRLSYDHKGSDENEGRRIANAGGLVLNNRVNGVLAVTRALGDTYIKELVTGHPYTTETVIQPELDEFVIIACDGLWDVCNDQDAVNLIRNVADPVTAAKMLVDHALAHFSTDNLSCMVVRFDKEALVENQNKNDSLIGVEGDEEGSGTKPSEAEKIVNDVKQKIAEGGTPAIGVSASNSGRGHDAVAPPPSDETFKPTAIEGSVEEEPAPVSDNSSQTISVESISSKGTQGSIEVTESDSVPAETRS